MHHAPPMWMTGTLYGCAQLKFWDNNDKLHTCSVWLRLKLAQVQWELAAPKGALPYALQNRPAELKGVVFYAPNGKELLRVESVALSHIALHQSVVLADLARDKAPLRKWPAHQHAPYDFPEAYEMLGIQLEKNPTFTASHPRMPLVYAERLQLPKNLGDFSINLPEGIQLRINSKDKQELALISLWSTLDWSKYREVVVMTLELLAHSQSANVQVIAGSEYIFFKHKPHMPKGRELVSLSFASCNYAQHITDRLLKLSPNEFQRFKISTLYHLHAKASDIPEEIRYGMEMTWLEMVDNSNTLCVCKMAHLLGVSQEAAEFLKEVRNKLLHEQGTLKNAITAAFKKIFDRKKILGNPIEEAAHTESIRTSLGFGKDIPLELYVVLRLAERIDIALWNFLKIPLKDIEFSGFVKWPNNTPMPTQDLDLQPVIERPQENKAHKNPLPGCLLKRNCK